MIRIFTMIRFFLAFFKLTIFVVLLLVLSSCKELFLVKRKLTNVSEIRLVTFHMDIGTEVFVGESEDENNRKELVDYPFFDSVKFSFLKALIDEFNKNDKNVRLTPLALDEVVVLGEQNDFLNKVSSSFSYFDPQYVFFARNIVSDGGGASKILKELSGDYFALLEFNTHPWLQNIQGVLRVYNKDKELVWSEKIKDVSGYILNDPKSPYLIKSPEFKHSVNADSSHAKEMEFLYTELAKKVALSFKDTLNKHF